MTESLRALWAADAADAAGFSPAELDRRARLLRRKLLRRDAIEYVAGSAGIVAFGVIAATMADPGIRLGSGVAILGMVLVLVNLWRRRMPDPPVALGTTSVGFYRAELVRQRTALATVWRWYIGPLLPGLLIFMIATWRIGFETRPPLVAAVVVAITLLPVAGIIGWIHWLNRRAVRHFDAEIAELDRNLDPLQPEKDSL